MRRQIWKVFEYALHITWYYISYNILYILTHSALRTPPFALASHQRLCLLTSVGKC